MPKTLATKSLEVPVQASPHELEPAWQTRLGTHWQVRTADPLEAITASGYFDPVQSHGLRANDTMNVVSLATEPASYATLAIDAIKYAEPGEPRVLTRILQKCDVQ